MRFYATRHTFISVALSRGCEPKWVAKYCGTSFEMLDHHYGRWMDDNLGQLACSARMPPRRQCRALKNIALEGANPEPFPEPVGAPP